MMVHRIRKMNSLHHHLHDEEWECMAMSEMRWGLRVRLLDQDQCMTSNRLPKKKKIILVCKRMVKIMMKRFTIILACKRTVQIMTKRVTKKNGICCEVYTNNSTTFKRKIGLHHLPIGEVGPSIKCSHLSLSRCGTVESGNMHPYNFEIQAHSLSISIAKTYHY